MCTVYPQLRGLAPRLLKRVLAPLAEAGAEATATLAYMENTDAWSDGWVGPRLILNVPASGGANALRISGFLPARHLAGRVMLTVLVDGGPAGQAELRPEPSFDVTLPLPAPPAEGVHLIEITTSAYFVPRRVHGSDDLRPRSWQLASVHFVA